jgi:hypothetical protein
VTTNEQRAEWSGLIEQRAAGKAGAAEQERLADAAAALLEENEILRGALEDLANAGNAICLRDTSTSRGWINRSITEARSLLRQRID